MEEKLIKILHIPKTGGTVIKNSLGDVINTKTNLGLICFSGHNDKLIYKDNINYIFFLRNPIKRFVSAYLSRFRCGRPTYDFGWNEDEKKYFSLFETPNKLSENLYEDDNAMSAMKKINHLNNSLSNFLIDEDNIQKCKNKILFVGVTEFINQDFYSMCDIINVKNKILLTDEVKTHKTPKEYEDMKYLSKKSIENLTRYYENDFRIINKLHNLKFIDNYKYNFLMKNNY